MFDVSGTVIKYAGCLGVMVAFVFPVLLQHVSLRTCRTTYAHWFDGIGVDVNADVYDMPLEGEEHLCTRVPLTLASSILMRPWLIVMVFVFAVVALLTVIVLSAVA